MKADPENEALARLLFGPGGSDGPGAADLGALLARAGSCRVEELLKEPQRLREEEAAVLEQTQQLAFKNYKTFVQTAECSRDVFRQFGRAEGGADALLAGLERLQVRCEGFARLTRDIAASRRLNSLMLTRNAQLLEVLELAQLMQSFVQDEQYENALELAGYVRRLAARHPQVRVFRVMEADVDRCWRAMLLQLVAQLRSDLQLPRCLQVVGYLRRMNAFSEDELRLKFLQARDSWLQASLDGIASDDGSQHLSRTIELTRVGLFGIVTQYRATFGDEERGAGGARHLPFHGWLQDRVRRFLGTLRADLARGVPSVESALSQCMYFGLSLSRVGCDFRPLVAPVFAECAAAAFCRAADAAAARFERNMERFTLINRAAARADPPGTSEPEPARDAAPDLRPPAGLLEFYPAAEYCNELLAALNELRLCAPLGAQRAAAHGLQRSLARVARVVAALHAQERQALGPAARAAFARLCRCVAADLAPHLQRCLRALFPAADAARHLGERCPRLAVVDAAAALRPLAHLLQADVGDLGDGTGTDQTALLCS